MYQDSEIREYTKPDLNAQFREGEVEWSGKWRNRHFFKDGTGYWGKNLWASAQEARNAHLAQMRSFGRNVNPLYSRTIQIPVKA